MSKFTKRFMELKGQTTVNAGALIFAMNECLEKEGCVGTFLETGVYCGRSAAIYLEFDNITDGILIDPVKFYNDEDIEQFKKPYDFVCQKSEKYLKSSDFLRKIKNKNLIHVHLDASHFYDNVKEELVNILPHVSKDGLVCLDDWNIIWPQVTAAYYDVWFNYDFGWKFLIHGFNKAILCHESQFPRWSDRILESVYPQLREVSGAKLQICRTEVHANCSAFHLRPLTGHEAKGDSLPYYGSCSRNYAYKLSNGKIVKEFYDLHNPG